MWPSNKVRIIFYYSYIEVDTWQFGWSYSSDTIQSNHYSTHHYSHDTLFISLLFIENTIHNSIIMKIPTILTIFLLFIPTIFIIRTSINFILFSKFLPNICVCHTFPKLFQLGNRRLKILCPRWALAWDLQVKTQQILTLAKIIRDNQVGI